MHISTNSIDLNALLAEAHHAEAGAIVIFSGEVRNHNLGKKVSFLEYESFVPMAEKLIDQILTDAKSKWDLKIALCMHRIGQVKISEPAVCVISASAHRKEAYEANQYIIHRVKHEVPIWKREWFTDGTSAWGNNCNCPDPMTHELPFFQLISDKK